MFDHSLWMGSARKISTLNAWEADHVFFQSGLQYALSDMTCIAIHKTNINVMSTCVLCQVKVIQGHEVKKGQTYIFDLYVIQCMFMDQIFVKNAKNGPKHLFSYPNRTKLENRKIMGIAISCSCNIFRFFRKDDFFLEKKYKRKFFVVYFYNFQNFA